MRGDYRAPNVNSRLLGAGLRQVREILGLSYAEATKGFTHDADWLAGVELGFGEAGPDDVAELLSHYGPVPDRIRGTLVGLASRPNGPLWLGPHLGRLNALTRDLLTVESEARVVRLFAVMGLPDLLWTEAFGRWAYEHRLMPEDRPQSEWSLLSARQRHRPGGAPRELDVILDYTSVALPMPDHPELREEQLRHLMALARSEHVTIRVVPPGVGHYKGLEGSFEIYDCPELNDRLSVVHSAVGMEISGVDLTGHWEGIEAVALSPADTMLLLHHALSTSDLHDY